MASINRGDNTGAFGCEFLRIYLNNPNNLAIQKAIFQINGDLEKEYYNPKFPLKVNFTGAETELLQQVNFCRLALWDENGRRRTADGKFTFFVKENQINAPDEPVEVEEETVEENAIHFDLDEAEFAAQFTINATPSKMSELQQDIPLMTADKIKPGNNIHIFLDEEDNVIINAEVDTTIEWDDILDKPTINGKPLEGDVTIDCEQVNADWLAKDGKAQILNKPNLADVAYTGNYNDLTGTPYIPEKVSDLDNDKQFINKYTNELTNYYTIEQVQDLLASGSFVAPINTRIDNLEVKHDEDVLTLNTKLDEKIDSTVYTDEMAQKATYDYVDARLQNKVDTNQLGKGTLSISVNNNVSTFSANSQVNKTIDITIPTNVSDLNNDAHYVKQEEINLSNFVEKQDYDNDKQTFATHDEIGKGTFTIKQNGDAIATFNANSTLNKEVDITVPTKVSELDVDIDILQEEDLKPIKTQLTDVQTVLSTIPPQIVLFQEQLDDKVDKEPGKRLMDSSEIERLSQLKDYDDTEVRDLIQANKDSINDLQNEVQNKVDAISGKGLSTNDYTNQDKSRLDNVENLANNLDNRIGTLRTDVNKNAQEIITAKTDISNTQLQLQAEQNARELKDIDLQEQIAALNAKSNVVDIVATAQDLETYDVSSLKDGDVICVIKDETKNDTMSYYRFNGTTFFYIGSVAESYTKAETDKLFVNKTTKVNGYALSNDIALTAADVHALPEDTEINDNTIMIKRNNIMVDTFTLNQNIDKSINIDVPTSVSQLDNDLDLINETYLFKYIGNVPEDDNLQDQVDAIREDVQDNAVAIDSLKDLVTGEIGGLPTVALSGSYKDLKDLPLKLSDIKKNNKVDPTSKDYIDDTFITELKEKTGYVTADEIELEFADKSDIPTNISQLENDRGYVTNSAIGRGILTLKINNTDVGTWMANEKDDYTWNIPVDNALSTTSTLPVQNNVVTTRINTLDSAAVHKTGTETISGNKSFTGTVTLSTVNITNGTCTTQATNDNSTKIATTAYVKNQDYCTNTNAVHKAQNETITGNKTFTGTTKLGTATGVTVIQTDNSNNLATTKFVKDQAYAVDSKVVHNYGDETIQGDKTFNDTTTFVGVTQLSKYSHVPTPDLNDETNAYTDLVTNVEFVQGIETTLNDRITSEVSTLNNTITTKDGTAVHKTGNETVAGVKTFSSTPILTSGIVNLKATTDGSIQYNGTNFLRRATSGAIVLAGTSTIYLRPNGDTNTTGQLQIATDGTVTATKFVGALTGNVTGNVTGSSGSCTGNAATATKATQDGNGNNIVNTYATKTALNGYVPLATYNAKVQELTNLITALTARVEALENA